MSLFTQPSFCRSWRFHYYGLPQRRVQPPCASSGPEGSGAGAGPGNSDKNADILARINKARQYKSSQPSQGEQVTVLQAAPPAPAAAPAAGAEQAPSSGGSGAGVAAPTGRPVSAEEQPQRLDLLDLPGAGSGTGSSEQAAGWLQTVVSTEPQIDPSLRPEMFTLMKEEAMKKKGGEVIVGSFKPIDRRDRMQTSSPPQQSGQEQQQGGSEAGPAAQAASAPAPAPEGTDQQQQQQQVAEGEGEDDEDRYKPKVATWGVFPRPQNISEAYGGGRNLRPGQALESEEQAAAREARVAAALKKYRKALGVEVDPAAEARAAALCEEGSALFKQGALTLALEKFAAAAELVPVRSRVGGEANLQRAICLDSLGRNQDAYEIYKTIRTHPLPAVAKQANRMLFGFKAAENLKTSSVSYAPTSAAWKAYFDRISKGSWNSSYYTSASEGSGGAGESLEGVDAWVGYVAVAVMVAPLALVAYKVLLLQQTQ